MNWTAFFLLPFIILFAASIGWTLGRGYERLFGDRPFRWWKVR